MGPPPQGRCGKQSCPGLSRVEKSRGLRQGLPSFSRRAQQAPASLQNRVVPRGAAATKILVQVQAKAPRLSATPRREPQSITSLVRRQAMDMPRALKLPRYGVLGCLESAVLSTWSYNGPVVRVRIQNVETPVHGQDGRATVAGRCAARGEAACHNNDPRLAPPQARRRPDRLPDLPVFAPIEIYPPVRCDSTRGARHERCGPNRGTGIRKCEKVENLAPRRRGAEISSK